MNRRGFLQGMLAVGVAPAIVQASNIMRIAPIVFPTLAETWTVNGALNIHGNTLLSIDEFSKELSRYWGERMAEAVWDEGPRHG